jgi:Zn-dependent protease with chaperone function
MKLSRQQVPSLFELVDELRKALRAPKIHHILLTSEFNAAVVQIPRLGLLGWQQNYLILGLPLMQALSPQQFRGVLAHELGHLSGNHSKFSGWIYRVRKTWGQIFERLHQSEQWGASMLFNSFFNWYAPYFQAYSFVLARSNEYEADRCAAQLAGSHHIAEALVNIAVKSQFLEQSFWTKIYQQANEQPNPPKNLFIDLGNALQTTVEPENAQKWLAQALMEKTNNADTHPCLKDRLSALGYSLNKESSLLSEVKQSAAEKFLGKAVEQLTQTLDIEWQTSVNFQWREQYTYAQQVRSSLREIEVKAAKQSLTLEEAWNRAYWTRNLKGNEEAIPLLKSVLEMQADHVSANYLLGQILLEQEDVSGIKYVEKAMDQSLNIVLDGCQLIYSFLQKQGRKKEAEGYLQRAEEHYDMLLLAQQERSFVSASDKFVPHGLSTEVEAQIRQQLASYPQIKEAYLVRKVMKYFPENQFYVLAVSRRRSFIESEAEDGKLFKSLAENEELLKPLISELEFSAKTWIEVLHGGNKPLAKVLRETAGVAIYRR